MNDKAVIAKKNDFIGICLGIKGLCADLYHQYSKIYEDIPAAAQLWQNTALEERYHQKTFENALCLIVENEFALPKERIKQSYAIQSTLKKNLTLCDTNKPILLSAVSIAVDLEEKLAALHEQTAQIFREKSLQRLFKSLSDADHSHIVTMQNYRTSLYHPLCQYASENGFPGNNWVSARVGTGNC